jgi:hypothetical protein
MKDIADIVGRFDVPGRYLDGARYGNGHINDTFACRWQTEGGIVRYILQRVNRRVFAKPQELMDNIERVTQHLRWKLGAISGADPDRDCLTLIPTRAGENCYRDEEGDYWRAYKFIEDTDAFDVCTSPMQAYEAARAFGRFQYLLADLPAGPLHETIPFFHHTPRRFQAFEEALKENRSGRAGTVEEEVEYVRRRRDLAAAVTGCLDEGVMVERVTHNDTKLNNVLMDRRTGQAVCVIDLDTVMSGSVLYDFGDMVRSCVRTSTEDEPDLRRVNVDCRVFEALVAGYLEEARGFLTPLEVELLAASGRLITLTIGIRFLTDYLNGDVYFKTRHPQQNLDRARVHFKLVSEMEALTPRLESMVRRAARSAVKSRRG